MESDPKGTPAMSVSQLRTSVSVDDRELASREHDGIQVLLLWHPHDNTVTVSVEDARAGERFRLAIAPDRALDAFYHPFAYAA